MQSTLTFLRKRAGGFIFILLLLAIGLVSQPQKLSAQVNCPCQGGQYAQLDLVWQGSSGVTINVYRKSNLTELVASFSNVATNQLLPISVIGQYNDKFRNDTYFEIVDANCNAGANCPVTSIPTTCGDDILGNTFGDLTVLLTGDKFQSTCSICDLDASWSLKGNVVLDDCNKLGTLNATDLVILTDGTEKIRVKTDGKVGIGTDTPTELLDVNGTARVRNIPKDNSLNELLVKDANGVIKNRDIGTIISSGAGDGIVYDAANAELDVNPGDGVAVNNDQVEVVSSDIAGSGLEDDGANNLRISNTAAGNGLQGGSGSPLEVGDGSGLTVNSNNIDVNTDNSTIEVDPNDNLRVKAEGITANEIATGAVTTDEILDATILTDDIASGGNDKVLTTDPAGNVLWDDKGNLTQAADGDGLVFDQTNLELDVNPGDGIDVNNDLVEVDADDVEGAGLSVTNNNLDVNTDNSTIEINANDDLRVKAEGITANEIATGAVTTDEILDGTVATVDLANNSVTSDKVDASVAGSGLQGGSGVPLEVGDGAGVTVNANDIDVNTDNSTIEIDGNDDLRVKAEGITANEIATGAVTTDEILDATILTDDIASGGTNKVLTTDGIGQVVWDDVNSVFSGQAGDGLIYDAANGEIDVNPGDGIRVDQDRVRVEAKDLVGAGLTATNNNLAVVWGSTIGTSVQGNTQISVNAGNGLDNGGTITLGAGGAVTLDIGDGAGITVNSNNIDVNTDNSTIEIDGNDDLRVKAEGITANEIATGAVTTDEILDGTVDTKDVKPGNANTILITDPQGNVAWDNQGNFISGADGDGLVYDAANTELDVNPGDGIDVSNDLVEVDADDLEGAGLSVTNNNLDVNTDNSTLEIDTNDDLRVKASGITANEIATGAVTTDEILDGTVATIDLANNSVTSDKVDASVGGNGLQGGSGLPLEVGDGAGVTVNANDIDVNTDNSTIEIDGNDDLRVKAEGITANEIATGAVTTDEILDGTVATVDLANNSVTSDKVDASVGGNGLQGGSGLPLEVGDGAGVTVNANDIDVNTDNSTIEIDGNDDLRVKAEGITANEIATGAVTTDEILDGTVDTKDVKPGNANTILITDPQGNVAWDNQGNFISGADGDGLVYDAANTELDVNPGDGIDVSNDLVEVDADDLEGAGLSVTNNNLDVNTDNSTLEIDGNDDLRVKASGITANEIATGAVTSDEILDGTVATVDLANNSVTSDKVDASVGGNGLQGGSGLPLEVGDGAGVTVNANDIDVNTDNSTIEIDGNDDLRVKAEGITANEIATGAVTTDEILDGTVATNDIASGGNSKVLTTDGVGTVVWVDQTGQNAGQAGDGIVYDATNNELDVNPGDGVAVNNDQVEVVASDFEGNGVIANNNNIDVNPGDGIAVNNDQVEVNAQDLDGSGTSITNNNIDVNTDNSTIEIDGNDDLRVKAEGITANEIATGAVTTDEILDGTISTDDLGQNGAANDEVLIWNGTTWTPSTNNDADADPINELQTLSQSGNTVTLSQGGGTISVADNDNDPTNEYNTNAQLVGTDLQVTDNGGTQTVDLSSLEESADIAAVDADLQSHIAADNDLDPTNEYNTNAQLVGTDLQITDNGGTQTVDLSSLNNSGTDDQNLTGATLSGTSQLQIDIENGNSTTVDLSALEESSDIAAVDADLQSHIAADGDLDPTNEYNTNAQLVGTDLQVTDNGGTQTVDLSSLEESADIAAVDADLQSHIAADNDLDPTNEYNTNAQLVGTDLQVTDNGGTQTVDLSSLEESADIAAVDADLQSHIAADGDLDPTNEYNTNAQLVGTDLQIIDNGGTQTVDLSSLNNSGTDDQNLTGASLSGTSQLQVDIENGNSTTVDLSALEESADIAAVDADLQSHIAADNDLDPTNEYNTNAQLVGTDLQITDNGGTQTVDLSSLNNSGTDDQNLTGASLSGTSQLQIDIENGNSTTVDLSALEESADIAAVDADLQSHIAADNDLDANNEIQDLNLSGNDLTITNNTSATNIDLSGYLDNTDNQQLSKTGSTISLSNGGSVSLNDDDASNEIQSLSLSGNQLSISGANTINLPPDGDSDASNELQTLSQTGNTVSLSNGGGTISVADNDNDSSNEIQSLSKTGSTVSLSNGGGSFTDAVNDADANPTNEIQTLSKTGSTVSLSNGGGSFTDAVNDADANPTNEIQQLSISGNTISLNNGGGSVTVPSTADNLGNHNATTDLDMNGNRILDVATPTAGTNAANKAYVDAHQDADADPSNEIQQITQAGNTVFLSNGGGSINIADNDNDSSNEIQTVNKSGNTVTLSNGGGSFSVADNDNNPSNEIQNLSSSVSGTNRTISISGGSGTTISVADNDNNSSNELQTISKSGTTVSLSNGGGSVSVADNDNNSSNELQTISKSGTTVTLSNGGGSVSVADNDNSSSNEIQNLSLSGNTLSLSSGGSVNLSSFSGGNDNLGNHSATTTLQMNNRNINGANQILIGDPGDQEGIIWSGSAAKIFVSPLNSGNTDGYLRLINDGGIVFEPGAEDVERVTFAANGNVGIGTTGPAEDLTVFRADNDIARVYATGSSQGSGMFYAGQSTTFGGGFGYDGDGVPAMVGGSDRITFFRRNSGTDTEVMSYSYNNSTVRINSLGGSGNRMVIANANGDLFTQGIPVNTDNQNLSSFNSGTNRIINISGGSGTTINVADNDNSSSNELQSLSLSGNTLSLSSGGSVNLSSIGGSDNLGNHTATTTLNMNNQSIINTNLVSTRATSSYDKLRVYSSSNYTIGMHSGMTMGGLNDWAMTFTMNNDADRGFIWRDESDSQADGAMALTTNGHLTVKTRVDIGTSSGSGADLYLADRAIDWDDGGYYLDPNGVNQMNDVRANIFYDRNNTTYYLDPSAATSGRLEGNLQIGYGSSTDDDYLYFDRNAEFLFWDESATNFIFSDDVQSGGDFITNSFNGTINCGGSLDPNANVIGDFTPNNSFATGDEDLYIEDDLEVRSQGYKPGGGSWATTSDARLKNNVQPYEDGLAQILKIKPVTFRYNEGYGDVRDPEREFVGVLAQDMLKIAPYMVEERQYGQVIAELEDGTEKVLKEGEEFYTFDPSALDYMLINAVQEQQKELTEQKEEIKELKENCATPKTGERTAQPVDNAALTDMQKSISAQMELIEMQKKALEDQQQLIAAQQEQLDALTDRVYLAELAIIEIGNCCDKNSENQYEDNGLGQGAGGREEMLLFQNHPNPFAKQTSITYKLVDAGFVELTVVNSEGIPVDQIVAKEQEPGRYSVDWDGTDFAAGVYTYVLSQDGKTLAKKMILIRY